MIARENWNKMDNEAIEKIKEQIKNEENVEEKTVYSDFKEINQRLEVLKDNLKLAAKKSVASQQAQAPKTAFWQNLELSFNLTKSQAEDAIAHIWPKTASTVIMQNASSDQGKGKEMNRTPEGSDRIRLNKVTSFQ